MSSSSGFGSEDELLSHLRLRYDQTLQDIDAPLGTAVQHLLLLVRSFLAAEPQLEVRHLLTAGADADQPPVS